MTPVVSTLGRSTTRVVTKTANGLGNLLPVRILTANARLGSTPTRPLPTKKTLIKRAEELARDDEGDSIQEVRRLREDWKNSGRISREKSMELNRQFNEACDMASEKSFLNRSARAKNTDFDNKTEEERLSIKIELLDALVKRDENDLTGYQDNMGNMASPMEARQAEGKLRLLSRKVQAKKELLRSLKNELASL